MKPKLIEETLDFEELLAAISREEHRESMEFLRRLLLQTPKKGEIERYPDGTPNLDGVAEEWLS
jgi:hypothetical protein